MINMNRSFGYRIETISQINKGLDWPKINLQPFRKYTYCLSHFFEQKYQKCDGWSQIRECEDLLLCFLFYNWGLDSRKSWRGPGQRSLPSSLKFLSKNMLFWNSIFLFICCAFTVFVFIKFPLLKCTLS